MAKKEKFYVVWKGRKPGIYTSWAECETQVKGVAGAEFKAFESREQAEQAYKSTYWKSVVPSGKPRMPSEMILRQIGDSYAVDAACSGNPGVLEYRCVHNPTGKEIFRKGPYPDGTNNVGEFLAIVDALVLFKREGITLPIYSDSQIAMGWVAAKNCRTTLEMTKNNSPLFRSIEQAEHWLHANDYANQIIKWKTEVWGEIPADFGRK